MIFIASWPKGDDHSPHEEYIRQTWTRLQPFTRGFYVNHMAGGVSPPEVAANYGPNAARLAAVKARWDPQNLFRLNTNILPEVFHDFSYCSQRACRAVRCHERGRIIKDSRLRHRGVTDQFIFKFRKPSGRAAR
ncbi:MAG: BBE domain-containing protein [Steroidobacteraceae bacterium]